METHYEYQMLFIALFSFKTKLQSEFVFTADVQRKGLEHGLPSHTSLESVLEKGRCVRCTTDLMHSASSGPQREPGNSISPLPLRTQVHPAEK